MNSFAEESIYWVWLSKLKDVSCVKKEKLLKKYKSPERIWNLTENELQENDYLTKSNIEQILDKSYRRKLERDIEYCTKNQIKIISIYDNEYPGSLRKIYDKPIVLYAKGNVNLLKENGMAIIGARECSDYGKRVAENLAYNLAKEEIVIISGLARGIDKQAHLGALRINGKTIAVIGNGIDNIYPEENRRVYERIIENNGLVISEYPIGTKPERKNFPQRNRIVSALSNGIVVVEAKRRSGALITVDFGLEHGKEIFAVPGNINSTYSEGCNNLIKEGANIVCSYKDILDICYSRY